jgi:hypothetical protein
MRPLVPILASTLLITACGPASNPQSPIGCWRLSFAQWLPSIGTDESLYPLPETIELTKRQGLQDYYEATRRPNRPLDVVAVNVDSLKAFWKHIGSDSIELWLPTWWSTGIRARLRHSLTSLAGSAEVYVDVVGRPVPRSVVEGKPIACRAT